MLRRPMFDGAIIDNLRVICDFMPCTLKSLAKLRMFRDFDPEATEGDNEVPDPWYGELDGYRLVLAMVERTADNLVKQLPELISH